MWHKNAKPSYITVPRAGGILDLIVLLIFVPIAALIYIVEAYRSGARIFAGSTADPHQTEDGTDEEKRS